MKKLLGILVLGLLLGGKAYTHEAEEHKPIVCIPESERTAAQKQMSKFYSGMHRLSKLDVDCLILRVEELEKENKELKDKLNQ